jgi:hypothetical protein
MKKLLLAFSIISFGLCTITETQAATKTPAQEAPCKCYCAFKPGPRDKKPVDKPFTRTFTNSKGQTFDVCLCAQRDLNELLANPALIDQITQEQLQEVNCCDELLNDKSK